MQNKSNKWIICHICLKTSDREMFPIFGHDGITNDLPAEIADFGSISLNNTKIGADRICERCLLLLKAAKKFRKLCQSSAKQWQELIKLHSVAASTIKMQGSEQPMKDVVDNTNDIETPTDETEPSETLEILDEQDDTEQHTGHGYVFEVIGDDEDVGVDAADENMLAPHDAQFIELEDDDDGMNFLDENSTGNSEALTYYSQSQFENLNHDETLVSETHLGNSKLLDVEQELENLKKQQPEMTNHPERITQQECDPESNSRNIKRGKKRTADASKKYNRNKAKDNADSKRGINNYVCSYCGNSYNEKAKLTLHLKLHTKEKPHECEICHKRFSQTPQLTRHMNSHTGNRPFECKFCDSTFADPSTCIKHQRIHTQERPYVCETCGKAFSYSNVLKVHVMSHTGEKPYGCKYCEKKFTQSHHARAHERTHI
ncbi:zinc finger protein ZFP2 [Eurosta solidaginis]|uniref:zinc finger protein ZFP2 n=1 Tax=Eurosta solidaginis TaxID=178769 RepID=UPI0035311A2A